MMGAVWIPTGLLAALAAVGLYWRHVWLREQVHERLATASDETGTALAERPFATRHPVIPWIVAIAVVAVLVLYFAWPAHISCGIGLVVALLGMELDAWILEWRHARIEAQLADAIDVLVASVGAGSSIQASLTQAAEYSPMPLRRELEEMVSRLRLGDAPTDVFDLLRQRVPIETFRLFTTTLSVNWEVGGGLSETLAAVGNTIRDRLAIARQVRTLSTQGRLTTFIVLAVTWFMAAMMWQSDPLRFVSFLRSPVGGWLLTLALVLQGVGIALVSKISRPKV